MGRSLAALAVFHPGSTREDDARAAAEDMAGIERSSRADFIVNRIRRAATLVSSHEDSKRAHRTPEANRQV